MKKKIYDFYTTSNSDDDFILSINRLAALEGELVYQNLFSVLVDLNLEPIEAKKCWANILDHRLRLSQALGRNFGLFSASCDYFSQQSDYLKFPKLTEIKAHNLITEEAHNDSITGLLNKNSFMFILNQQVAMARGSGSNLSVLFADIDDFKRINDSFGHGVGDKVLKQAGKLINRIKRRSDFAFRYGGDEFVILMPDTSSNDGILLANRLRESMLINPVTTRVLNVTISLSTGVASFPSHARNGEELVRFADSAMYQAKNTGKDQVCLFDKQYRH
jgi:diguanylate cyclase (GGDEF)-like protein